MKDTLRRRRVQNPQRFVNVDSKLSGKVVSLHRTHHLLRQTRKDAAASMVRAQGCICGWCGRAPRRKGGGGEIFRKIKHEFQVPRNFQPPAGQEGEFACLGCFLALSGDGFDPRQCNKQAFAGGGNAPVHSGVPSELQRPPAASAPQASTPGSPGKASSPAGTLGAPSLGSERASSRKEGDVA